MAVIDEDYCTIVVPFTVSDCSILFYGTTMLVLWFVILLHNMFYGFWFCRRSTRTRKWPKT